MSQFTFLSIEQFKATTNSSKIDFMFNPSTNKLFAAANNGSSYKAQQDINIAQPVRFMYSEAEGFDKGCFVNVKPLEVKFSL